MYRHGLPLRFTVALHAVLGMASVAIAEGYPTTNLPATSSSPAMSPIVATPYPTTNVLDTVPVAKPVPLAPPPEEMVLEERGPEGQATAENAPVVKVAANPILGAPALSPPVPTQSSIIQETVVEPVAVPVAEEAVAETILDAEPIQGDTAISGDIEGPSWYMPSYWFGPTPWDSGFELGLNGSSGTSDSLSFRTGGFVKREADDYKLNFSLYYNKTSSEGVEVQSNALLDTRYDWLFDDSPWTLFVMSQTFFDEFAAFDLNFNVNSGIGYQWLNEDWAKFTTSIGTGASREFGAPMEEWVAEANFGFSFEQQVDENKKFYAKLDYFPEWEDFSRYRILADMGLEIELVQPSNVSLKFSATDRYDSHPDGAEPHNLNYSALLIWKL